jgi:hypothetical protein
VRRRRRRKKTTTTTTTTTTIMLHHHSHSGGPHSAAAGPSSIVHRKNTRGGHYYGSFENNAAPIFGSTSRQPPYYDSHEPGDDGDNDQVAENKETLCNEVTKQLVLRDVHPNDATVDHVDILEPYPAIKPPPWMDTIQHWVGSRAKLVVATIVVAYIYLSSASARGVGGWFLYVPYVLFVAMVAFLLYEIYRFRAEKRVMLKRATVYIYFTAESQLYNKREVLDEFMDFFGPTRFDYGISPTESLFYIRWSSPPYDEDWIAFTKEYQQRARRAASWRRWLPQQQQLAWVDLASLLLMLWAMTFLSSHWYGYNRPTDGVWKVARYYFAGTPLEWLTN